jgi:hypothetical protein
MGVFLITNAGRRKEYSMAVDVTKNRARFALEGFRVKRCNPDKTYAGPQRTLGFVGAIDLTGIVDGSDKAPLSVKIDGGPWQEEDIDFSAADITEVNPSDAVTALTGAVAGVTFSVDTETGRLKASATGAFELQIKGKLAAALDFGQGRKYGGFGVYYVKYFNDETIGIALPNDMKDKEEIDLEGAMGTITRMVIPAKRLGVSPAITAKFKNDELLQMIQGGEYISGDGTEPAVYFPPTSQESGSPLFSLDVIAPLYGDGTSNRDQVAGFDRRLFWCCTGTEGDVPMEAKAWAQFAYNVIATEYTDENGVLLPADKRFEYNLEQFEALRIYDV